MKSSGNKSPDKQVRLHQTKCFCTANISRTQARRLALSKDPTRHGDTDPGFGVESQGDFVPNHILYAST